MKKLRRFLGILLAAVILLGCMFSGLPAAEAAKATEARTIAIVFDNSGSMYLDNRQEWCRATYAMEVFASMLNKGDTLQIYPMHPITVGGKQYTMESPLQITDSTQASTIRQIYTEKAEGTPIESIDCAVKGLKAAKTGKRYMIVLTDGTEFDENNKILYGKKTVKALDERIQANAGKDMTVMYLGIGKNASMPDTAESEYFIKKKAENSDLVLSTLTYMCNQIFGRDTLPKNHFASANQIDFDISISKLIVFVQGENISDLKLTGNGVGTLVSSQQTKYSTAGAGGSYKDKCNPDTSLQGMMVTYTDCAAGNYTIDYKGSNNASIEVYYEPDADLDFVFTDAAGNTVDPNALYEGDYKVSFGMKDGKTGKLITSDLLGKTHYEGSYSINGQEVPFSHDGSSGVVSIPLSMGDTFEAKLTVTYLSGYTISKDSSDFGWPAGGIKVAARPAGDFRLEITGGDDEYSLQDLEKGAPYIAKVYYKDTLLTGEELEKVELKWDPDTSNVEIKKTFADDHWKLKLHYKNPDAPQDTVCGECTVAIHAFYTAQGSDQAQTQSPLRYYIKDDFSPIRLEMFVPESYIVIGDLAESQPIVLNLKLNGAPLTAEEFAATQVQVDCGGIAHTVTPNEQDSSYSIKLMPTEGIEEGNYEIKVTAVYTDHIGRQTEVKDSAMITLSNIPLWVRWLIGIGLLILLILLIWWITHIRMFPSTVRAENEGCRLSVGGKDVTENADFTVRMSGKQVVAYVEYNAEELGRVAVNDLVPGKESYLYKSSPKRSFLVKFPDHVSVSGEVTTVDVAGIEYRVDKEGTLRPVEDPQAPYVITNGTSVTINGKIMIAGKLKNFNAEIPMNFKKR